MHILYTKKNKAFVMLFAVILASIVLAIALGVSSIALKEIKFSTSAKDTNDAFFAADTGAECALYNDTIAVNKFPFGATTSTTITCNNFTIISSPSNSANTTTYSFILTGLGSDILGNPGKSCVTVSIKKDNTVTPLQTHIIAKGYNTGDNSCRSTSTSLVERELHVDY